MEWVGPEDADFSVTARRNASLSSSERVLALCSILAISFGISLMFSLIGAWPVMPFAGLEVLVLCWAFREIGRREGDYERIVVSGDTVTLETVELGRVRRHEFNRYWAQVVIEGGAGGRGVRVVLRSHGRETEFGRHLPDSERLALAQELKRKLARR